jgi:hypothetical protein
MKGLERRYSFGRAERIRVLARQSQFLSGPDLRPIYRVDSLWSDELAVEARR